MATFVARFASRNAEMRRDSREGAEKKAISIYNPTSRIDLLHWWEQPDDGEEGEGAEREERRRMVNAKYPFGLRKWLSMRP